MVGVARRMGRVPVPMCKCLVGPLGDGVVGPVVGCGGIGVGTLALGAFRVKSCTLAFRLPSLVLARLSVRQTVRARLLKLSAVVSRCLLMWVRCLCISTMFDVTSWVPLVTWPPRALVRRPSLCLVSLVHRWVLVKTPLVLSPVLCIRLDAGVVGVVVAPSVCVVASRPRSLLIRRRRLRYPNR